MKMSEKDFEALGEHVYYEMGFDYFEVDGKTPEDNYNIELDLDGSIYQFSNIFNCLQHDKELWWEHYNKTKIKFNKLLNTVDILLKEKKGLPLTDLEKYELLEAKENDYYRH